MRLLETARQERRNRRQASASVSQHHNRRYRLSLSLLQIALVLVLTVSRAHAAKESVKRIHIKHNYFPAEKLDYFYLKRGQNSTRDGETFVMRDRNPKFWISHDHGKTWKAPPEMGGERVSAVFPNKYFNDMIIFQTASGQTYYSLDRGESVQHLNTPGPLPDPHYSLIQPVQEGWIFHPSQKDWLIWFTVRDCQSVYYPCIDAYLTQDRGSSWKLLRRNVQGCRFVAEEARGHREKLIYCEEYTREEDAGLDGEQKRLVTSDDFFEEDVSTPFDDIIAVQVMSEFTTVAVRNDFRKPLEVYTSVDGKTFALAQFPANINYAFRKIYTFLDSPSHSQLVFILTKAGPSGSGIGAIFKSNSNSTSFVLSTSGVNLYLAYFADLEKMEGLDGVWFANIVSNTGEETSEWPKKQKTVVTHDDGATWDYIPAPPKDAYGMPVKCNVGNREKCSLHLHRRFKRSVFASSPSAAGLMVAVGNVGEYLGDRENSDTYITRDGGLSWHAFLNGPYLWGYGDQGSVILLVREDIPTNSFLFTIDEGRTWEEYRFTNSTIQVIEISSVLNSQTLEFLLWAEMAGEGGRGMRTVTFNVDFTELKGKRKCDPTGVEHDKGDFYLWEPRHPARSDSCLLGHVAQYRRKRPGADCYVGDDTHSLHAIKRNCQCTREDYEWYISPSRSHIRQPSTTKLTPHLLLAASIPNPNQTGHVPSFPNFSPPPINAKILARWNGSDRLTIGVPRLRPARAVCS
jgi:hypothetical protein